MLEEIVLHIGYEKTGTTSIQRFLGENRAALKASGTLYPESPGEYKQHLLTLLVQDQGVEDLRLFYPHLPKQLQLFERVFELELGRSGCRRVVLSSEHCSSRLKTDAPVIALKRFLNRFCTKIRILVYVRRQDRLLTSAYSMAVKAGSTRSFEIPSDLQYYNYKPMLDLWARVFGADNLTLRVFHEDDERPFDVVADFAAAVGIDAALVPKEKVLENRALDAKTLEFLRLFNAFVPSRIEGKYNAPRFELVAHLLNVSTGEAPAFDRDKLAEFYRRFADANAAVARSYAGRPDGILFDPPKPRPPSASAEFSARDAVEIAARVWLAQASTDKAPG